MGNRLVPQSAQLSINLNLNEVIEGEELIVSIMSLEGKILEQKQVNYFSGLNIPIEKLNSGHYHLVIQHKNQVAYKSFIKK